MKKAFIGMERSGALRRRLQAKGWYVVSVDLAPSEDGGEFRDVGGFHWQGDVFDVFKMLHEDGMEFDLGIFHPDCTYLTWSAEWAYKDPDFKRYPGVGYHQRVKPETLVGAARRKAREKALTDVRRIRRLPIKCVAIENPEGAITRVAPFTQIVQPLQFGHDASKATGLILKGLAPLDIDPLKYVSPPPCMSGVQNALPLRRRTGRVPCLRRRSRAHPAALGEPDGHGTKQTVAWR